MSNTEVRRVALKADLATVQSGALDVKDEEHPIGERVSPCCELLEGGIGSGETDNENVTIAGDCAQRGVEQSLRLTIQNATAPWSTMATLIDDVCNALEIVTGNLRTAAGVNWVLCDYESASRAKGVADGIIEATVTVRFSYNYALGSM